MSIKEESNKLKIVYIVDTLDIGGAEIFLCDLLTELKEFFDIGVVVVKKSGPLEKRLDDLGIPITCLSIKNILYFPIGIRKLLNFIQDFRPCFIHSWMYHSNFLTIFIHYFSRKEKIIWSIHNFNIELGMIKIKTKLVISMTKYFSNFIPRKIIFCSQSSMKIHLDIGFNKINTILITNGINLSKYSSTTNKEYLSNCFGIPKDKFIIGMIARFDVQKNHIGFIESLSYLKNDYDNFHCILVGRGCDNSNRQLINQIERFKLNDFVTLAGERRDISEILSNINLFAIPSLGEAFPISLCEAMASSIPCVGNDVGDIRYMLGNNDLVIKAWDPKLFAKKIFYLSSMKENEIKALGKSLHERAISMFDIHSTVHEYKKLYLDEI